VPLSCAAKTVSGAGLETLRKWIAETDATALILHDRRGEPLVVIGWDGWNRVTQTAVNRVRSTASE
jgi:hypothetical protein